MANLELDFDITCIDTHHMRDDFVACYLIKGDEEYALIDAGVKLSVPDILQTLQDKNIDLAKIKYLMPTHCHLDHAGGIGELLQHTPYAQVVAHPSCAKHLIEPESLETAVKQVYGENFFNKNIGGITPVAEERIILAENQVLTLGKRKLQLIETYGHAYHHYTIFDELSNGVFAGDTLGVSYKELNTDKTLIFPPTTPTQFDPENWLKTIDNLTNLNIDKAYLTHYSQITWNQDIAEQLKRRIKDFCIIAKSCKNSDNRINTIQTKLAEYLDNDFNTNQHKILKADLILCAGGLDYWLNKL
jgi:glyoxylase-like metal-dependent hydrolase (beta-lactamase superfamily II)